MGHVDSEMVQTPLLLHAHTPFVFQWHMLHTGYHFHKKDAVRKKRSMDLSLMMEKSNSFKKVILRAESNI